MNHVDNKKKKEWILEKRIPLSECECFECMKDEFCQACEDFGHQKLNEYE